MTSAFSFDPLDDRYRWCVYCQADCWPDPDHQRHDDACPRTTGLYPVRAAELRPGETAILCCRCDTTMALGELYALIDVETDRPTVHPDRGEVVCIGCAALAEAAAHG